MASCSRSVQLIVTTEVYGEFGSNLHPNLVGGLHHHTPEVSDGMLPGGRLQLAKLLVGQAVPLQQIGPKLGVVGKLFLKDLEPFLGQSRGPPRLGHHFLP